MLETQQPYQIVQRRADIEYRCYAAATFAQVRVRGSYTTRLNSGFRELSYYITGGNRQQQTLPLHAPVVMTPYTADEADVRMYLGTHASDVAVPTPLSSAVVITQHTSMLMAVVTVGGLFTQSTLERAAARLYAMLRTQIHTDTPEYHFYTSPWQLFGRRGEVAYRLDQHHFAAI